MTLDRTRVKSLTEREQKRFVAERPKSQAIYERGKKSLLSGVPMNWMVKWAGAFPPVVFIGGLPGRLCWVLGTGNCFSGTLSFSA